MFCYIYIVLYIQFCYSIYIYIYFHQPFKLPEHNGMDDWRVTLIDRAAQRKELRRRESFWQYKLNTFFPHGLNKRNVQGEYD